MKAIIYAGIGLFSVATVYGLADYYSTQKKGTLDKLYKEEEVIQDETEKPSTNLTAISANPAEKKSMTSAVSSRSTRKTKRHKRTIRLEEFSRGRIIEPLPVEEVKPAEPAKTTPTKTEEIKVVDAVAAEGSAPLVIKKDPDRKISLSMFSRAPLRAPVKKSQDAKPVKVNQ